MQSSRSLGVSLRTGKDVSANLKSHITFLGETGVGKDSEQMGVNERDLWAGRSVMVLADNKGEYACCCKPNTRIEYQDVLDRLGIMKRGYKVNYWIPYVDGFEKTEACYLLRRVINPLFEYKLFRIHHSEIKDASSLVMSLGVEARLQQQLMSSLLRESQKNPDMDLIDNVTKKIKDKKDFDAKQRALIPRLKSCQLEGAFDLRPRGPRPYHYLDLTKDIFNKKREIHVISTRYSHGASSIAGHYLDIAMLLETLAHAWAKKFKGEVAISVPEVWLYAMRNPPKELADAVSASSYALEKAVRLLRQAGIRFRLSTQGPASINENIIGQCRTKVIGRLSARNDLGFVARTVAGWDLAKQLPKLKTAEFVTFSPKHHKGELMKGNPPGMYKLGEGEEPLEVLNR